MQQARAALAKGERGGAAGSVLPPDKSQFSCCPSPSCRRSFLEPLTRSFAPSSPFDAGEIHELKQELKTPDKAKKKDVIKKVRPTAFSF